MSLRDCAAERRHEPDAVMEATLAHMVKKKAEAACARNDLLEKCSDPMASWADYLAR